MASVEVWTFGTLTVRGTAASADSSVTADFQQSDRINTAFAFEGAVVRTR